MALKANSKIVLDYVKVHDGEDFTAADIASATGLEVKSVNGIVTAAFQKKGLMVREAVDVESGEGTIKTVKFIRLTDAGREFVPTDVE